METERRCIWLWQNIISPHMAGLAVALARKGCDVTYLAQQPMLEERAQQGWAVPTMPGVHVRLFGSRSAIEDLVSSAPVGSIHVCGGLRGNGLIGVAQRSLSRRALRQWVVMEGVDDAGWKGLLRRVEYARLFRSWRGRLQGVLAIGHGATDWISARGMRSAAVFPFAYFLPDNAFVHRGDAQNLGPFSFIFVGQLVPRKRLGLLVETLGRLEASAFQLTIVGSGPDEMRLRKLASTALPGRVKWLGALPMDGVPNEISNADCLILPSSHDGWGAVVNEALMVGTPVVCSDSCGAAGVVQSSGRGAVFQRGDHLGFSRLLEQSISNGRIGGAERRALAQWATCLGADTGASYLLDILDHVDGGRRRPLPPWETASRGE